MPASGQKPARPTLPVPPGIQANASFGQNFLLDAAVLDRSVAYGAVGPEDTVLEIGPGIGHLTRRLCAAAGQVHAIEADPQFRSVLEALQTQQGNLTLHWGDATALPFPAFTKMVANLPYKVALPLIFRLVESDYDTAVLVIQHSQARRLCAGPGQQGYSRLSVAVQRLASLRLLEVIKPDAFSPSPQVDNAMVRLRRIRPRFPVQDEARWRLLLDWLFHNRKAPLDEALGGLEPRSRLKILRNALHGDMRHCPVERLPIDAFGSVLAGVEAEGLHIPSLSDEDKRTAQKSE